MIEWVRNLPKAGIIVFGYSCARVETASQSEGWVPITKSFAVLRDCVWERVAGVSIIWQWTSIRLDHIFEVSVDADVISEIDMFFVEEIGTGRETWGKFRTWVCTAPLSAFNSWQDCFAPCEGRVCPSFSISNLDKRNGRLPTVGSRSNYYTQKLIRSWSQHCNSQTISNIKRERQPIQTHRRKDHQRHFHPPTVTRLKTKTKNQHLSKTGPHTL